MSEAEAEAGSMLSVVASLSKSFDQVPPSAVPAVLDCILLSTGLSPRSLFASLLHDFPRFLKVFIFNSVPLFTFSQPFHKKLCSRPDFVAICYLIFTFIEFVRLFIYYLLFLYHSILSFFFRFFMFDYICWM